MNSKLDWIERESAANMKYHLDAADDLKKDSTNALTIFLAGGGASLGFALSAFQAGNRIVWIPAALISASLFLLSALVLCTCLRVREIFPPTNEPRNLDSKLPLNKLREQELESLQGRINATRKRNEDTAYWLNFARGAAIAAFILALAVPAAIFWLYPAAGSKAADPAAVSADSLSRALAVPSYPVVTPSSPAPI